MTRERQKDDLGTPAWLLDRVRDVAPIALDPCSNEWSEASVRALSSCDIDLGQDGLAIDWLHPYADAPVGLVFCNPPYGRGFLRLWSEKIANEAARGVEIVSLVPCSPDTEWWATLRDSCDARCDVATRIAFEGGQHGTGQIKSEVFYHGPRRFLFAHAFDSLGEVVVYSRRKAA